MKALTLLALAAAIALTSPASADKYDDLVTQGYRWSTANGPFACVAKEDVHLMTHNPSDSVVLKMVEQVKAYFLLPGMIVLVTETDTHSGLSKIRIAGITVDLWTLTKFLTKRPVKDTYGVIEIPETLGLIPSAVPGIDTGPTPGTDFGVVPGLSPAPGASPTPAVSPESPASPEPGVSPEPSVSPTPAAGQ